MKKFRLKISYETGLLTLITFFISIVSLGWQIFNYFQGAKVALIPSNAVAIGASDRVEFPNRDGGPYVHFIVRMSYVNTGATGYNATIQVERIRIKINNRPAFEHEWFRFVTADAGGVDGTDLKVGKISDAHPFPLAAGTSESHETLFQPSSKECMASDWTCQLENYVTWQKFVEWMNTDHVIELEALADIYGNDHPISIKCKIEMQQKQFENLVARRWASPICK